MFRRSAKIARDLTSGKIDRRALQANLAMAHVVRAYIVETSGKIARRALQANIVIAHIVMACIVMASGKIDLRALRANIVTAHMVMTYIVMASGKIDLRAPGKYTYGPCSNGLYSNGLGEDRRPRSGQI